jgi:hypothetical protein
MHRTWSRFVIVAMVGGLCLVGYGLAQAAPPSEKRFIVLSKDPAWVLDRTTGLQWQKTPNNSEPMSMANAMAYCTGLGDGARLPEIQEMQGLIDYSKFTPALPAGHPFTTVQSGIYWSATTYAFSPSLAWMLSFDNGQNNHFAKDNLNLAWCVR